MIDFLNDMAKEVVIGTIGPGANQVAVEWCVKDLLEQPYKLWHFSLNHYRNIYGYSQEKEVSQNITVGLFPVLNC
mgnify:CR=1 FL=1